MKKDPDFLILVEHAARELDIACLIKYHIEQNGGSVDVLPLRYFNVFSVSKNRLKVLVVPYCYTLGIYQRILPHFADISFVNLAFEQIFANITENMRAPKDEFVKKYVIHHAWNKQYFDFLTKYDVDPVNIRTNGNLSFALYKDPYRNFFIKREEIAKEYQLDTSKKWLFIPENYGAAFYTEAAMNLRVEQGADRNDTIRYQHFAEDSLHKVIRWCAKAAESKDIEIIFRPRPAISYDKTMTVFSHELKEIPRGLHIIKGHTVREWILASDIIMSSYSTTLIEAAVAEKPIAMLYPLPFPDFLYTPWYDLVPKILNYDDFIAAISSPSKDSYQSLKRWAESSMLCNGDPLNGIVDILLETKRKGIRVPEPYTRNPNVFKNLSLLQKIINHFHSIKGSMFVRIEEEYETDLFSNSDVTWRVTRWEKILGGKK